MTLHNLDFTQSYLCFFPSCARKRSSSLRLSKRIPRADAGSTLAISAIIQAHQSAHAASTNFSFQSQTYGEDVPPTRDTHTHMYLRENTRSTHARTHTHFSRTFLRRAQCTLAITDYSNMERMHVYNISDLAT